MPPWFNGVVMRIRQWAARNKTPSPVDLERPLEAAVADAEVFLAFAAQSRRGLKRELIDGLSMAIEKVQAAQLAGRLVTSVERAEFWFAYDEMAVAMAPLSAHSIRSSMRLNALRFPASLFTPTAGLALLAVAVFGLSLVLQTFWVSGKEMLDKADALDLQRAEASKLLAAGQSGLRRSEAKAHRIANTLCQTHGKCTTRADLAQSSARAQPPKAPTVETSRLISQLDALDEEIEERNASLQMHTNTLADINAQGAPLRDLLQAWHDRAQKVCGMNRVIRFMCPVDENRSSQRLKDLQGELQKSQTALREADEALSRAQRAASESLPPLQSGGRAAATGTERSMSLPQLAYQRRVEQTRTERMRRDIALEESAAQRRIAHEVRIILSNLAAYVVPLVMGLLGSLAYILQLLTSQLKDHTYVPSSISGSIVRVCLGAIAGVFGGLTPGTDPLLKNLPPLFVPFVFGYGIEILFSLLNRIVKSFTTTESPPGKT